MSSGKQVDTKAYDTGKLLVHHMQTTGFKQLLFIPIIGSLLTDKKHSILAIIASKEGPVVEFAKVVATNAKVI